LSVLVVLQVQVQHHQLMRTEVVILFCLQILLLQLRPQVAAVEAGTLVVQEVLSTPALVALVEAEDSQVRRHPEAPVI
jgi:hypothetical protein